MDLTVVLAHLSLMEADASSDGLEVPRDAVCIDAMRLGESQSDARVLRQIAVGVLDRQFRVRLAYAVKQHPAHDAHEGFRPERMTALDLQLDLSCVISLVACLAQRDQVVWRITARFPTLKMMHVEDLVPRTTMTVLANMTVSEKNVLAHVLLCGYPQAPLARPEGRLFGPRADSHPSSMLERVSCLHHRSYLSELLNTDRRAWD